MLDVQSFSQDRIVVHPATFLLQLVHRGMLPRRHPEQMSLRESHYKLMGLERSRRLLGTYQTIPVYPDEDL